MFLLQNVKARFGKPDRPPDDEAEDEQDDPCEVGVNIEGPRQRSWRPSYIPISAVDIDLALAGVKMWMTFHILWKRPRLL